MAREEPSHIPRYRVYYEQLSLAFQDIVSSRRHSPTLDYLGSFKEDLHQLILSHLPPGQPHFLDAGCGGGTDLLAVASQRSIRGCGADFALNNLRLAQKGAESIGQNILWVQSAVECLPFADGAFEGVLLSEVIEHLLEPDLALREIRRVLKPGGLLFLSAPNRHSYFSVVSEILPHGLKSALKPLIWNMPRDYEASRHYREDTQVKRHVREFSPGELRRLLETNGFRAIHLWGGRLAVPVPSLFDRWKWLLAGWRLLDKTVSLLPSSASLKENLLVLAAKDSS